MPDAQLECASDKARLLIALVIAKCIPDDYTPLEYVLKLRRMVVGGENFTNDNQLVGRIELLEERLRVALVGEARAKLELVTYQAQHPPTVAPGTDRAPDSPSKKYPKKKKKQTDAKPSSAEFDLAVERVRKAFDARSHLESIGLVCSLLRLRTQTQFNESIQSINIEPLLERCLIDAGSHIRHVCDHPTSLSSLDGLDALQIVLPQLLVITTQLCDNPDLTSTITTVAQCIIQSLHPISAGLLTPAVQATSPTRTRRGKIKTGARAAREVEEASGSYTSGNQLVDVRPGLLAILSMLVRVSSSSMPVLAVSGLFPRANGIFALLPLACRTVRDLVTAPYGQTRAERIAALAVTDSIWYLCSACHVLLEGADRRDEQLYAECADIVVEALREERGAQNIGAHTNADKGGRARQGTASRAPMTDAVHSMVSAVLERIIIGF